MSNLIKVFHFKKFIFNGGVYRFNVKAKNIDEALRKAVNWGMKKYKLSNEYFSEQLNFAKKNLRKGEIVVEITSTVQTSFDFYDKFNSYNTLYDGLINERVTKNT